MPAILATSGGRDQEDKKVCKTPSQQKNVEHSAYACHPNDSEKFKRGRL
jgi:hypothetical protein